MDTWSIVWILVYVVAALAFFGAAAVITVVGSRDLKDLLSRSDRNDGAGSTH
jgi:hypothetical protein